MGTTAVACCSSTRPARSSRTSATPRRVPAHRNGRLSRSSPPRSHDRRGARRPRHAVGRGRRAPPVQERAVAQPRTSARGRQQVDVLELAAIKPRRPADAVQRRALRLRRGRRDPVPARLRRRPRARRRRSDRARAARRWRRQRQRDRDRGASGNTVVDPAGPDQRRDRVVAAPPALPPGGARAQPASQLDRARSRPGRRARRSHSTCAKSIFHDLEESTGVNVWTFAQNPREAAGSSAAAAPAGAARDVLYPRRERARSSTPSTARTPSSGSCSRSRCRARWWWRSSRSAACSPSACARSTTI